MDKNRLHNDLDTIIDVIGCPVDGYMFYTIKENKICGNSVMNLSQIVNTLSAVIKDISRSSGVSDAVIVSAIFTQLIGKDKMNDLNKLVDTRINNKELINDWIRKNFPNAIKL